jgi:hypothetical protein
MTIIVPSSTPTDETPPPLSLVDGCPRCIFNTEEPVRSYEMRDGWLGIYRCTDCDHEWFTAWKVS